MGHEGRKDGDGERICCQWAGSSKKSQIRHVLHERSLYLSPVMITIYIFSTAFGTASRILLLSGVTEPYICDEAACLEHGVDSLDGIVLSMSCFRVTNAHVL